MSAKPANKKVTQQPASPNRTPLIVAGVAILVAALAVLAVVLAGGGDDGGSAGGDEPVPTFGPDAVQNQPVSFTGEPLPVFAGAANDSAVGLATPIVEGADPDGNPITLGGATERPTLYVFLAHWCPHCNAEIPEILEWYRDGGAAGVDIVGISTGVDQTGPNYPPTEWLPDKGWLWPTLADDATSTAFLVNGGNGFPYLMLVDADGTVLARDSGEKSASALASWVTDALG